MPAIKITDEMRQAVYADDCKRVGHIYDIKVGHGPLEDVDTLTGRPESSGETEHLPYVDCRRCGRVWLVLADSPGTSYEDAEEKVIKRMRKGDPLTDLAEDRRERRRRRRERDQRRTV